MHQLATEFKHTQHARVEQFQALQRAHRPPSKGGPAIPHAAASISHLDWLTARPDALTFMPFGQPIVPSFGQQVTSAQAPAAFQQNAAAAAFGQGAPSQGRFGSSTMFATFDQATTFVSSQGTSEKPPTTFGSAAPAFALPPAAAMDVNPSGHAPAGFGGAFGANVAPSKPAFGQQVAPAQVSDTGAAAQPSWGFGASAGRGPPQATSVASQPQLTGFSSGFGTGFGFGSAQMQVQSFGLQPPSPAAAITPAEQEAAESDPDVLAWRAPTFERGKIPERAPPPIFCK